MHEYYGKILILIGLFLIVAGIILYLAGDKLGWLGRLPGDIRIEKENVKVFIPITTMLLLSIIITLLIYLIRKLF